MKRILILSAVVATSLFATNGSNLIGLGVESRALGGTGIAMSHGSESALSNPALLGKAKVNQEFSFGGTIFSADVKVSTTAGNGTNGSTIPGTGMTRTSDEGTNVIPVISLSERISNNLTFGLGMYGTAGMGTDWRKNDTPYATFDNAGNQIPMNIGLYNMRSSLMLMQFAPSLAYNDVNFGLGVSAIIQYGALSIDYDTNDQSNGKNHIGNGSSNDFGTGFHFGGYYNASKFITLGAVYKSAIDMEYKDQISNAAAAFGYGAHAGALAGKTDHLEQPAEIGIGISIEHKTMTYTIDYKNIKWGDAKGYKDFGWRNQKVIALGAKYQAKNYWLGLGYNSSENPIPNNKSTTSVAGAANTDGDTMNLFNYAMFPATIEKAYTFGAGYDLNNKATISFAHTISPEASDSVSANTVGVGSVTTKHSQNATTIAYKYQF